MDLASLLQTLMRSQGQPQATQAPQGLLGSGMVQQAAQIMQSRPYQLHVQEAQALGQTPLTPQQFMQQNRMPSGFF